MIRKIIKIDPEKCDGCGLCVRACHEGAIGLIDGKARLLMEDHCDGLGDCLPACPAGAISFENREAASCDPAAAAKNKHKGSAPQASSCQCSGTAPKAVRHKSSIGEPDTPLSANKSLLSQWPVQIKLIAPEARFLSGSNLLIAADCAAYAFGDFHNVFIRDRITLIGCPKLDNEDYGIKLSEIIKNNDVKSVTVARMAVPCCGGLEYAVKKALRESGKCIPCRIAVVSPEGEIIEEKEAEA
jgi:ferredoxin